MQELALKWVRRHLAAFSRLGVPGSDSQRYLSGQNRATPAQSAEQNDTSGFLKIISDSIHLPKPPVAERNAASAQNISVLQNEAIS